MSASVSRPNSLMRAVGQVLDAQALLGARHLVAVHRGGQLVEVGGQPADPAAQLGQLGVGRGARLLGGGARLGGRRDRGVEPGEHDGPALGDRLGHGGRTCATLPALDGATPGQRARSRPPAPAARHARRWPGRAPRWCARPAAPPPPRGGRPRRRAAASSRASGEGSASSTGSALARSIRSDSSAKVVLSSARACSEAASIRSIRSASASAARDCWPRLPNCSATAAIRASDSCSRSSASSAARAADSRSVRSAASSNRSRSASCTAVGELGARLLQRRGDLDPARSRLRPTDDQPAPDEVPGAGHHQQPRDGAGDVEGRGQVTVDHGDPVQQRRQRGGRRAVSWSRTRSRTALRSAATATPRDRVAPSSGTSTAARPRSSAASHSQGGQG